MARIKTSKKHEGLKRKETVSNSNKRSKEKVPDELEEDGDVELLKGSKGEGQLTTGNEAVDVRIPFDLFVR